MAESLRVLCMSQAFKGSLRAADASSAMAEGVRRALPHAALEELPMADGGDDTLDVLVEATGGREMTALAHDALMRPIQALWGVLGDGETAVIEMAQASGLRLLKLPERDPRVTTTYGTGQLIKAALDASYRKLVVGIGGSATVDGGTGAAAALGARFLDDRGQPLPRGGAALARLAAVDLSAVDPRVKDCRIRVACDVDMPLCGPRGAWRFSLQKGATPSMAQELAQALEHYGAVVARETGVDLRDMRLAGPGGGIAGGLHAFLGAELVPGSELVLDALRAQARVQQADLVLTGEGTMDANSFRGKGPGAVADLARRVGVPVIAVVGQLAEDVGDLREHGIVGVETLLAHSRSEAEACERAWGLIAAATAIAMGRWEGVKR